MELKFKYVVKAGDETKISRAYTLKEIEDNCCQEEVVFEELDECTVMDHNHINCDCSTPFYDGGEIIDRLQSINKIDINGIEMLEGDKVRWGKDSEMCERLAVVVIDENGLHLDSNVGVFFFGNFIYKDTEKHLEIYGNIHTKENR